MLQVLLLHDSHHIPTAPRPFITASSALGVLQSISFFSQGNTRRELELELDMAVEVGGVWRRYAPHNMMILVQLSYTFMYFFTEAAFNRGLNPYVYVTYRHLLVAVVLWPFAYYHEKYII
jgi:hypothetical protein